jgi:hypothetical protein
MSRPFRGREGIPTRIGDQVRFRVGSVFVWPEEGVLCALPQDSEIDGTVIGFSDSGAESRVFAVVEVTRKYAVIVPVRDLK